MYLRARGRRVGCAQRSKLRFALRARENEEVDIEFLRISCACIRSLTGGAGLLKKFGSLHLVFAKPPHLAYAPSVPPPTPYGCRGASHE